MPNKEGRRYTSKWYGGYNSKEERENHFGFITREIKPDLFIHREDVRCAENALGEGTAVTFEVAINPRNGKEAAKNLLLLTEETDLGILTLEVTQLTGEG